MIVDTHIHLYDERYQEILFEVIEEALANEVRKMIIVGYDKKSSIEAVKMAQEFDFFYAAVGLHPSDVKKEKDLDLTWLHDLLQEPKVVAIGEIGLDYYWDKSYKVLQIEFFKNRSKLLEKQNFRLLFIVAMQRLIHILF
jgi:TatD DNase family protein